MGDDHDPRAFSTWSPKVIALNGKLHLTSENGQAMVVEFDPKPHAKDGDLVHLTLEDGRVLICQILDNSPFCAVIGDGPLRERRSCVRT